MEKENSKAKHTLVLGATDNPARYSNLAVKLLQSYQQPITAIGKKAASIGSTEILIGKPDVKNIDTISLYLNPQNQKEYYDYILSLNPKRIIFNPGTENEELETLAQQQNIETIEACTLVMLKTGQY